MRDLLAAVEREVDAAVQLRRRLHAVPELGNAEERTAALVEEALGGLGAERVGGAGVVAAVGPAGSGGRAVALRAELDGLPVEERTGASFAATGGTMHACGHDVHMAALVAVARAGAAVGDALPARLVAVFQPSEETYPSGAEQLIETGLLKQCGIGAAVAVHVHPDVAWGRVAVGQGAINASSDFVRIVVEGAGGHGAYPHRARDPILALAQIVVSLQQIVSRRLDPLHAGVVSIGSVRAGHAENVIPDRAEARGTLRALRPDDRVLLEDLVREVAAGTAAAHGCEAAVEITSGEPALVNDTALAGAVRELLGEAGVGPAPALRSCGSDDFGFYTERVPSVMLFLGLDGHAGFEPVPLHHPRFLPPDDAVGATARALVAGYVAAAREAL